MENSDAHHTVSCDFPFFSSVTITSLSYHCLFIPMLKIGGFYKVFRRVCGPEIQPPLSTVFITFKGQYEEEGRKVIILVWVVPVQNWGVKEQGGDHKEQRDGGCDVCTSSGKWVLRSAVVQMLLHLPSWWGRTCLGAKCSLIEDCCYINKIEVVRTYPYHDLGDLSSQLNSPRGKLRNNREVNNGFQGLATAPVLSQSWSHQSLHTRPKLELGWMQNFLCLCHSGHCYPFLNFFGHTMKTFWYINWFSPSFFCAVWELCWHISNVYKDSWPLAL